MHSGEKPNKCDQCEGKSGCQSHQTPQESATAAVPRISVYCLSASLSDSVTQIAQWFWWLVRWQYWRLHPTQQQLFQVSSKKWLGSCLSPQWFWGCAFPPRTSSCWFSTSCCSSDFGKGSTTSREHCWVSESNCSLILVTHFVQWL